MIILSKTEFFLLFIILSFRKELEAPIQLAGPQWEKERGPVVLGRMHESRSIYKQRHQTTLPGLKLGHAIYKSKQQQKQKEHYYVGDECACIYMYVWVTCYVPGMDEPKTGLHWRPCT